MTYYQRVRGGLFLVPGNGSTKTLKVTNLASIDAFSLPPNMQSVHTSLQCLEAVAPYSTCLQWGTLHRKVVDWKWYNLNQGYSDHSEGHMTKMRPSSCQGAFSLLPVTFHVSACVVGQYFLSSAVPDNWFKENREVTIQEIRWSSATCRY